MRFIVNESFEYKVKDPAGVERLVASYVKGYEYSCRTAEMEAQAMKWQEDGKVTVTDITPAPVLNTNGG
jgi:hypothetical protein